MSRAIVLLVAFLLLLVGRFERCEGWPSCTFPAANGARRLRRLHNDKRMAHQGFVEVADDGGGIGNDGIEGGRSSSRPRQAPFSPSLVDSLDLLPLMLRVAAHAATRRGRDALMALVVAEQNPADPSGGRPSSSGWGRDSGKEVAAVVTSRERRARSLLADRSDNGLLLDGSPSLSRAALPPPYRAHLASTREQAQHEYRRVEQAMLAFRASRRCGDDAIDEDGDDDDDSGTGLSYPNLYGAQPAAAADGTPGGRLGPWSDDFEVETDDDEWLAFRDFDEFQLEHVAQAEQVVKMLLTVHEWASTGAAQAWAPLLSEIGRRIRAGSLTHALGAIRHGVEIVRVRSIVDPHALSTFRFQLNATTFPVMGKLREESRILEETRYFSKTATGGGAKLAGTTLEGKLEELRVQEQVILRDLVRSVMQSREDVQAGLNAVAELDVLFAKAAFGVAMEGRIPAVTLDNSINVEQFVHPLLGQKDAVPIDLRLSRNRTRALVVTGMNGGGKTLALKSFGVVAYFVHAGIPIPIMSSGRIPQESVPAVHFFDDIAAAVGDRQEIVTGESTFTASLNTYSTIIDRLSNHPNRSCLVLLDELGAGTEPNSGGAIGQAILERFLQSDWCRAVVTTHSPRLKAVAYESSDVDCASVLRAHRGKDRNSSFLPTFRLQYGVIGESDAIGAASRADPPLPFEVLERASELLGESIASNGGSGIEQVKYIRALSESLESQIQLAEQATLQAQREAFTARQCRNAMMKHAQGYDRHLSRLVNRVESCYQLLQADSDDSLMIAGETLDGLRVIRKQVQSEAAMLREQGLKVVPDSYTLTDGESVVVVSDGEWSGLTGRVLLRASETSIGLAKDEVEVHLQGVSIGDLPAVFSEDAPYNKETSRLLVFKRRDLAIWDYDSVWDDTNQESGSACSDRPTSVQDSKRRLFEVLASLKTTPPSTSLAQERTGFKSSRARKNAKQKSKTRRQNR